MLSTVLALALLAGSEANDPATQQEEAQQAAPEAKEEKRICRRISEQMNSRRKTKVCMTKQEWREFNRGD